MEQDITKTGPVGLRGLNRSDRSLSPDELAQEAAKSLPEYGMNAHQIETAYTPSPVRHLGYSLAKKGVGASKYDEDMTNPDQANYLNDYRFFSQSAPAQIATGAMKGLVNATTTTLDGVFGNIYGLGTGIKNLFDKDPNTGFLQGLWDNDFNKAMANIQSDAEDVFKNYYSDAQQDSKWNSAANLLSANFLGDVLLKNLGFTMGMLGTSLVPGVNGSWLSKAVLGIGKAIPGLNAITNTEKASKIADRIARSFVAAHSEASVEAINAVQGEQQDVENNLNNKKNTAINQLRSKYAQLAQMGANTQVLNQSYAQELKNINSAYSQAKQKADHDMVDIGNSVYGMNVALLSLTDNLEFSKYLKGGFNMQKGARMFTNLVKGNPEGNIENFGRAIAHGTASVANNMISPVSKKAVGRVIAGTIGHGLEEGFEEGAQDMISDSGQLQAEAKLNSWANQKYRKDKDRYSLFSSEINPNASEQMTNRLSAMAQTWQNDFGTFGSHGWQDAVLGAITGVLGNPLGLTRNNNGKLRLSWQGGAIDEVRDVKNNYAQNQLKIDELNKRLSDPKTATNARHAIAAITFANDMNKGIENNDINMFKTAELMSTVNDALFFKNNGLIDAYKSFYEEAAKGIDDKDIAAARALMVDSTSGKSYFDNMTNDQLKETLQHKAESTLGKINSTLNNFENLTLRYGDKYNKLNPAYSQEAIRQLTVLQTNMDDLKRREGVLRDKKENKSDDDDTNYDSQIKSVSALHDELKERYDNYIKNPKSLIDDIADQQDRMIKEANGRDDKKTLEGYQAASNLNDIASVYYYSRKPEVLDNAIKTAEGTNKELLTQFKPIATQINSLHKIVTDVVNDFAQSEDQNRGLTSTIGNIVDSAIQKILTDPKTVYTKETVTNALKESEDNLRQVGEEREAENPGMKEYTGIIGLLIHDINNRLKKVDVIQEASKPKVQEDNSTKAEQKGNSEVHDLNELDESTSEPMSVSLTDSGDEESKPTQKTNQKNKTPQENISIKNNKQQGNGQTNQENQGNADNSSKPVLGKSNNPAVGNKEVEAKPETKAVENEEQVTKGQRRSIRVKNLRDKIKQNKAKAKYVEGDVFGDNDNKDSNKSNGEANGSNTKEAIGEGKKGTQNTSEQSSETSVNNEGTLQDEVNPDNNTSKKEQVDNTLQENGGANQEKPISNPIPSSDDDAGTSEVPKAKVTDADKQRIEEAESKVTDKDIPEQSRDEELPLPNSSYRSNAYLQYEEDIKDEGGKNQGVARERKADSAKKFREDMKKEGLDFDYITNHVLHKLMAASPSGKLNVRYLTIEGRPKDVFLSIPYNKDVEKILPRNMTTNIRNTQDGEYLVVGVLGYINTKGNKSLNAGHDYILKNASESKAKDGYTGKYYVSPLSNFIYAVSPGSNIRRLEDEDAVGNHDVKELLSNKSTNPNGIGQKGGDHFVWGIGMGSEETGDLHVEYAGIKDGDKIISPEKLRAGKIWMFVKDSRGNYIPLYVKSMTYNDDYDHSDTDKIIRQLVKADSDKERVASMGKLRDLLVFNKTGNNLFYEDDHTRGNYGVVNYKKNNIKGSVTVNLTDPNVSAEEKEAAIKGMISDINPRVNLDISVFRNGGERSYIDKGMIRVASRILGTVNAQGYLYPIDRNGKPIVDFVSKTEANTFIEKRHSMSTVYANDKQYFYDGDTYFDSRHHELKGDELEQVKDIRQILTGHIRPLMLDHYNYYDVGGHIYGETKNGNFVRIEGENLKSYNNLLEQEEINKQREEARIARFPDVQVFDRSEIKVPDNAPSNKLLYANMDLTQQNDNTNTMFGILGSMAGMKTKIFDGGEAIEDSMGAVVARKIDGKITFTSDSSKYMQEITLPDVYSPSVVTTENSPFETGIQKESKEKYNDYMDGLKKESKVIVEGDREEDIHIDPNSNRTVDENQRKAIVAKRNAGNFDNIYKTSRAKNELKEAIAGITGKKPKSLKEIKEILSKSKKEAGGLYMTVDSPEKLDKLIESIKTCGI